MSPSLTFPTVPSAARQGHPDIARACECGPRQLVVADGDTCTRCGRYPAGTIARTWHDRARRIHRRAQ